MRHHVGRWQIEHDADATRECYSRIPPGTGCTCDQCRNFDAATGRTFPPEFLALADALGIDPIKPAELCHWCREPSGFYRTGGWFHLVGEIISGADVIHEENGAGMLRYDSLVPDCEIGFTNRTVLVPEAFEGHKVLQLEFQTRVPWVLAEPAPASDPCD